MLLLLPASVFQSAIDLHLLTWNERWAATNRIVGMLTYIAGLAILAIQHFRYRYTFCPVERQQSKWIITAVITGLLPLMITGFIYSTYWDAHQYEAGAIAYFFNFCAGTVFIVSLTLGIFFSIF
jgi:hypothetical protein